MNKNKRILIGILITIFLAVLIIIFAITANGKNNQEKLAETSGQDQIMPTKAGNLQADVTEKPLTTGEVNIEDPEQEKIILTQHEISTELKCWYKTPASDWESEATPIGNGFIGGMVFGGVESDRVQINEHSLWSGGPGASSLYDGGARGDSTSMQAALKELQELLQKEMTDFTANNSAYLNTSGTITAKNYSNSARIDQLMETLKGEKNNYGSYQTLGNLLINDMDYLTPVLMSATSTAEPLNGGEVAANLFDGSTDNKWYSGNSAYGSIVKWPVCVTWMYSSAYTTDSYSVTSGNDVPGRDPQDWSLYGSDDGTNYTLLDNQKGVTFSGRLQTSSYKLSQAVSYRYYKLEIMKTLEGNPPQLSEISFNNSGAKKAVYSNYSRTLDLNTAIVTVKYDLEGITYTKEYFISNPGNVMVIRLTASEKGALNRQIAVTSEQSNKNIHSEKDSIYMTGQPSDQQEDGLKFAQQVKVINKGGTLTAANGVIEVNGADSVLILMSAGTNYQQAAGASYDYFTEEDPLELVKASVSEAAQKSYAQLLQLHLNDYQELFLRVDVGFGSSDLPLKATDELLSGYNKNNSDAENRYLEMLYYQFGRYLLISSSREGSLPANLQGIWSDSLNPPWAADYHTNINLQMNYWLAEQTNLAECHTADISYINSLVARGTETAKFYYGEDSRGWVDFHENNIWGNTYPAVSDAYWFPTSAAWLCQDIWEYYRFNQDKEFLADNFDTMLNAALFWVDNLWVDERDGTLVTNPSYSPEHGEYSLGCSCDQAIIWELFHSVIEAAKVLDINTPEIKEIQTSLSKLYLPKVGLAGEYLEWKDEIMMDITGDGGHRHVNQLFSLHPGTLVIAGRSETDDILAKAMEKALITRGDGGTGWSKAWKINMWARLRDGDHAGIMVNQILLESTLKNLFDTHAPFQIDGNFGATAGMTEMILQSQGDSIDLMAAIPSIWSTGHAYGLKARSNFEVSLDWADKKLTNASITSLSGSECVLNYNQLSKASIIAKSTGEMVKFQLISDNKISFVTTAGETYEIKNIP